ncbi:MAG TPA: class A beta-lactamase [Thermoanaerobaculia bacterium]|nr:class A beta-lactamase [Thermoanaerobaculia bacterium]
MFALLLAFTLGYHAIDLDTGRTMSMNAEQRFPMGSVFKFPLAIEVLHRVDEKKLDLEHVYTIEVSDFSPGWSPIRDNAHGQPVVLPLREVIRYDLAESDNTAADYLLKLIGGPQNVHTPPGIRIDRSEKQMAADLHQPGGRERYAIDPRDTSTPKAMAELLRMFYEKREGLSPASHDFAMKAMLETKTGPKRIISVLPKGATLAHKTGTMPGTFNDVGIITSPDGKHHIALAIFVKESKSEKDEQVIAKTAEKVYRALTARVIPSVVEEPGRVGTRGAPPHTRVPRLRSG